MSWKVGAEWALMTTYIVEFGKNDKNIFFES